MPQNQIQRMIFAFITVVITVHAYIFYSLYVINSSLFISLAAQAGFETTSVLKAINAIGGVPAFGRSMPIWAIVFIEFVCAYFLECIIGSPLSFKLACRKFDRETTNPALFESAIISATVGIMCPAMSFLATFFYFPYGYEPLNFWTFMAHWCKLVIFNFPFAFFTQMYFIQPAVRKLFRTIFANHNKKNSVHPSYSLKS
ncbi:MAG: hypothetical protein HDR51_07065 [Treponema sp.]|nr:hypothetical protein [Treponema sp.]